jgi:hypothetical protein
MLGTFLDCDVCHFAFLYHFAFADNGEGAPLGANRRVLGLTMPADHPIRGASKVSPTGFPLVRTACPYGHVHGKCALSSNFSDHGSYGNALWSQHFLYL